MLVVHNGISFQQTGKVRIARAQMIDPDRGINQDHSSSSAPPGDSLELRLGPPQPDETAGALSLDQGTQGLSQEKATIIKATKALRLSQERVVERNGSSHLILLKKLHHLMQL